MARRASARWNFSVRQAIGYPPWGRATLLPGGARLAAPLTLLLSREAGLPAEPRDPEAPSGAIVRFLEGSPLAGRLGVTGRTHSCAAVLI